MSHATHGNDTCCICRWVMVVIHIRVTNSMRGLEVNYWVRDSMIHVAYADELWCRDIHVQTTTHCNTLHHVATHCTTLHHTAPHNNTLQHTATRCNTLQHTVLGHMLMIDVTRMNEPHRTYKSVMSTNSLVLVMPLIRMSHVTWGNESCPTYEWVTSHLWMSHV